MDEHAELRSEIAEVNAKCERILGKLEGGDPVIKDHGRRLDRIERALFAVVFSLVGLLVRTFWKG